MDYKERLERATLMAMQGILANPNYSTLDESTISFESVVQAKDIIQLIDQQFLNQEPQETQEPKRGQVVWVRDYDFQKWTISHFIKMKKDMFLTSPCSTDDDRDKIYDRVWKYLTTKNPYTDGK